MAKQVHKSREWSITPILCLIAACNGKQPDIPTKPTTLVGQVFTQLESGSTVKAGGREVFLTLPTTESKSRVAEVCQRSERMSDAIRERISGSRRVGREELPLEYQIMLHSDMLTSSVSTAFSMYGTVVSTTTTDIDGRYKFESVQSGSYVITAKHELAERRFGWTDTIEIHAGQRNTAVLGPDAATWVGLCAKMMYLKVPGQ